MIYEVELAGRKAEVDVRPHPDGGWWISLDGGAPEHVTGRRLGAAEWWLQRGPSGHALGVHVDGERLAVQLHGHGLLGTVVDPRDHALDALAGVAQGAVASPMPGAVVRVAVTEGQQVTVGTVLVVVEAMKMENEFKSPVDGVVGQVHVAVGQAIEANAMLVTVESE
jgi:acetyl/propionyl-CoA carboxylase alpha subunit